MTEEELKKLKPGDTVWVIKCYQALEAKILYRMGCGDIAYEIQGWSSRYYAYHESFYSTEKEAQIIALQMQIKDLIDEIDKITLDYTLKLPMLTVDLDMLKNKLAKMNEPITIGLVTRE